MPVYTYVCDQCKIEFEAFASVQKKESGWMPDCPKCGGKMIRQTFKPVVRITDLRSSSSGRSCCSR